MLTLNDAMNFRRTVAGLSLLAAPVVLGAGLLVHPGESDAGLVASVAAEPVRTETSSLLIILSTVLFVPALAGVLHLVRGRGVALTHVGVGLMVVGVVGHAVWTTFQLVMVALVHSDMDQAQLAQAVEGGGAPPVGLMIGLVMFLGGFFLGGVVLGIGLWRSHVVPTWVPVFLIVGSFADFVPGGRIVLVLGAAAGVLGFGAIGLQLLRMSDAEWERAGAPVRDTLDPGRRVATTS